MTSLYAFHRHLGSFWSHTLLSTVFWFPFLHWQSQINTMCVAYSIFPFQQKFIFLTWQKAKPQQTLITLGVQSIVVTKWLCHSGLTLLEPYLSCIAGAQVSIWSFTWTSALDFVCTSLLVSTALRHESMVVLARRQIWDKDNGAAQCLVSLPSDDCGFLTGVAHHSCMVPASLGKSPPQEAHTPHWFINCVQQTLIAADAQTGWDQGLSWFLCVEMLWEESQGPRT